MSQSSLIFDALCMANFIDVDKTEEATRNHYCSVKDVTCASGEIRDLNWCAEERIHIKNIDWMPQNLRSVTIVAMPIASPLKTRLLPKKIRFITLDSGELDGTLDMHTLPAGSSIWRCHGIT